MPARGPLRCGEMRYDELADLSDDVVIDFLDRRTDCVFDGVAACASVRHDAISAQSQQRRSPVGFVIEALAQSLGSSAHMRRPFSELKLIAQPLPGVRQLRGRYVQSLAFVSPEAAQAEEISRFVQATRLTAIRR